MPITPLFAAAFGLIYLFLSASVIRIRFGEKISLGTADNRDLEVAVRSHANFAEYVPFCLLLLWFLETLAYASGMAYFLACLLMVSRVAHVIGLHKPKKYMILRQLGIIGTFLVIFLASIRLIWWYVPASL